MNVRPGKNFFIRHLPESDPRREQGRVFQIQAVDRHGLATAFGYLGEEDERLFIEDYLVPQPVLVAVKRLSPGEGRFVDTSGSEVFPKDLPSGGR